LSLDKVERNHRKQEEKQKNREVFFLIFGVFLGGLFGILGNLWSNYYVEWLKATGNPIDWNFALGISTFVLLLVSVVLVIYAFKVLKK